MEQSSIPPRHGKEFSAYRLFIKKSAVRPSIKHSRKYLLALFATLTLISCGGGSSSGSESSSGGTADGSGSGSGSEGGGTDTPSTPIDTVDRTTQVCEFEPVEAPACTSCGDLPTFSPLSDNELASGVKVGDYGAVGDGVQQDHKAIQAAIDSAGVGGTVVFEGGKTYSICTKLVAREGQRWTRSGNEPATIKRCDAPVARLTQSAVIGDTTVHVDDSSEFEKGMYISPVQAAGNNFEHGEYGHHAISSVSGNTIVFYNGLDKNYSAGDKLITSFAMINESADDVIIEGFIFDGNRAANDHYVSWARHSTMWLSHANTIVRYNSFINSQGDALTVQGEKNLIEYNSFSDLNGSAFHFSAARGAIVRNNNMTDTNEQFERVVHAEAAVTWSQGNYDVTVADNCIRNSRSGAFGKIAFHVNNKGAHITGNNICNTNQLLWALTTEDLDVDLKFSNNTAVNAGEIDIYGLTDQTLSNIEIENNTLINSLVSLDQIKDATFVGNHIEISDNSILDTEINTSTAGVVHIIGSQDLDVSSNFIYGGTKGIFVRDSEDIVGRDITFTKNSLTGQSHESMTLGFIRALNAGYDEHNNYVVENNLVCQSKMESSSTAVYLPPGAEFHDNCVISNEQAVALYGQSAALTVAAASLSDNLIISDGANFDIKNNLLHGLHFIDNTISEHLPSELHSVNNTIDGNEVSPSQQCTLDNIATPRE